MLTGIFPSELILKFFRFLPTPSQFQLAQCSRLLNQISGDHYLWRSQLKALHHFHESPLPSATKQNFKARYERIFSEIHFLHQNKAKIISLGENHPDQSALITQALDQIDEIIATLGQQRLTSQFVTINELLNFINAQIIQMQIPPAPCKSLKLECITRLTPSIFTDNRNFFDQLERLDCSSNLIEEIPAHIGTCQKLESLNLYQNTISYIAPNLSKLDSLKYLYLSNGSLSEIPEGLYKLKNLLWFAMDNMQLRSLANINQLRSLTWLYLPNNQLTLLPPELSRLRNLQYLNLQNNQLSLRQPQEVVQLMRKLHIEVPWLFLSQERSSFDQTLMEESDITGLIDHFGLLAITPKYQQTKSHPLKRIKSTSEMLVPPEPPSAQKQNGSMGLMA